MQLQKTKEKPQVLCPIAFETELQSLTANLRCPILLNSRSRIGCQVILPNPRLSQKEPIFTHLKSRLTPTQREQMKNSLKIPNELDLP